MTGVSPSVDHGRAIVVSTSSQLVAKGVHLLLNVGISLALIRYLGPASYGDYVLVLTVVGLLGLVSDFGLTKLAVRDLSQDEEITGAVIGTVVVMRLALGLLAAAVVQVALLALTTSPSVRLAAAVASLIYLADAALTVTVVFHARLEQQYEALVRIVMEVVELAAVVWVIASAGSLAVILATPVVGATAGVVLAWSIARRRVAFEVCVDRSLLRRLLRDAAIVGPIAFVGVAYLKLDAVMVSVVLGAREVGLYGAAYQPVEYLLLASAVIVNVLFALLARSSSGDDDGFLAVYRHGTTGLLAAFLPVPIVIAFVAPDVVDLAFGPGYAGAAAPLQVLAWALVPLVLQSWQSFVLLAAGHQRAMLPILGLGVLVNVAVDLVLLRWFGLVGAAYGTLLTSLALLAATTAAVARRAEATLRPRPLGAVLAAGGALATTIATGSLVLDPVPAAALGALAYPWFLHRFGVLDWTAALATVTGPRPSSEARAAVS